MIPAPDKRSHYMVGSVILAVAFCAAALILQDLWLASAICFAVLVFFAAGKEVLDKMGAGTPEFADFWWTLAPAIPMGATVGVALYVGGVIP